MIIIPFAAAEDAKNGTITILMIAMISVEFATLIVIADAMNANVSADAVGNAANVTLTVICSKFIVI
jgi:hypothetical protein